MSRAERIAKIEAWMDEFLDELFDPVNQAELILRLADYEATRTDPWRFYCRICGCEGQADSREDRDVVANAHLDVCFPGGRRPSLGWEESREVGSCLDVLGSTTSSGASGRSSTSFQRPPGSFL